MKKRLAAEWEPAKGVMVTWPLLLPHSLIVEFTRDIDTFILYNYELDPDEITAALKEWDANLDNVHLLPVPQGQDANWIRDWGPHAVFTLDGKCVLTSPDYHIYGTPNQGTDPDGDMTSVFTGEVLMPGEPLAIETLTGRSLAQYFGSPQQDCHFVLTGGNIMSDGYNTLISTVVLVKENELNGLREEDFFKAVGDVTGMTEYSIIPNYENLGIQHVDCMFKMIDDETLFVARPPKDHEYYERYENIVNNVLSKIMTRYGRPFKIKRFDTARYSGEELAAYSNSIILNKTIYVPLFDIPQDDVILGQWEEALPGYKAKGFKYILADEPENPMSEMYPTHLGWTSGDSLHCRTRAVWDPEMLYMSVRRAENGEKEVFANVVDYSKAGIEEVTLHIRKSGENEFADIPMHVTANRDYYLGSLDGFSGKLEYFVSAQNRAGKVETMPRTAPIGLYRTEL